jgi:YggT family protein
MELIPAITRLDVGRYLQTLIYVYVALIFIRVLMSYITRMPYNRFLAAVVRFVEDVTGPYLNLFRRFIPMVRLGPAGLDLSPIVATFALIILGGVVVNLVAGG